MPAARGRPLRSDAVRFLGHGAERSGPPIHLLRLVRWWAEHSPDLHVEVVLARPGELIGEYSAVAPVRVARLDPTSPERLIDRSLSRSGVGGLGNAVLASATRTRVGRREPAVTVVNGATAPTAQLMRSLRPSGPVLMIAHELSTGWFGNIADADRELFLRRCDGFAAVSQAVADFLSTFGVPTSSIAVIPPATDLPPTTVGSRRPTTPTTDHPLVVAGGGMTDWRKAPELWLRVAAEIRRSAPELPVRFVWFGGARLDQTAGWPLRHEVDHLGLRDHVEFVGPLTDPWPVLARSDLFVSTAREDAAPLVCSEAAACGLPILTFDTGGAAELVADGDCGVVVPYPEESQLASAVIELAARVAVREDLGERGRRFVTEHRVTSVIAGRTEAWIREAMT